MKYIIDNWYVILGLLALISCFVYAIVKFLGLPTRTQINKIKSWLLYAVIETEKELCSGTGKIKLSKVYDMFLTKFPMTAKFITFEKFSELVDNSLETMKQLLKENIDISLYVNKK